MNNLAAPELTVLSRAETDPRKRIRLLAVAHFLDGHSRYEIARMLKVARRSVNTWISAYLCTGIDGLEAKKAKGRTSYLSEKQKQQLVKYIEKQSQSETGGRLTGEDIHRYILESFNVQYHPNSIYLLLKQLNISWITSRSRHPKQSQAMQDAFKKLPAGNDPSYPR